jgi:hypothetical protein
VAPFWRFALLTARQKASDSQQVKGAQYSEIQARGHMLVEHANPGTKCKNILKFQHFFKKVIDRFFVLC